MLGALSLVTACGSTATTSPGGAVGVGGPAGAAAQELSSGLVEAGAASSSEVQGTPLSSTGTAAGTGGLGPSGTGAAPAAQGAGPVPATTGRAAGAGPKKPVEIGVMIMDGQEALDVASSAGNCDATCSGSFNYSQEAMAKAMVEWINGRGGLAGHRVELAIYRLRLADIATRGGSALASEACQYWTQDRRVSALVLTNLVVEDFVACAARAGVPIMNGDYSNYVPDRQELRGHGRFDYASANFNLDDIARHYVNALVQQGFLKPGNKIGLIYKETPIYQRVIRNTLERELARHGLALAARGGWTDDKQSDQATWNNYVLNFKSKGVDRVLSFGGWVFGMAPFSKAAENQEYRPRYGVSSFTGPADAKVHGVPPRQLIGAQGVGWWPFADVIHKGDAAAFNPAAAECKKIIIGADQPWSALTYRNAMKFCDNFFLLKTLADKAGSVSQPAFYAAADRLGKAFTSPYMWETTFRPGDHHGATYLRNLGYDESCECFAYSGEKYLPRW